MEISTIAKEAAERILRNANDELAARGAPEIVQTAINQHRLDERRIDCIDNLLNEDDRLEIWIQDGGVILSLNDEVQIIGESLRQALDKAVEQWPPY